MRSVSAPPLTVASPSLAWVLWTLSGRGEREVVGRTLLTRRAWSMGGACGSTCGFGVQAVPHTVCGSRDETFTVEFT